MLFSVHFTSEYGVQNSNKQSQSHRLLWRNHCRWRL